VVRDVHKLDELVVGRVTNTVPIGVTQKFVRRNRRENLVHDQLAQNRLWRLRATVLLPIHIRVADAI
jgi:hypothetical protein